MMRNVDGCRGRSRRHKNREWAIVESELICSLNVYNTALEVRKAREQGRVEGREEVSLD